MNKFLIDNQQSEIVQLKSKIDSNGDSVNEAVTQWTRNTFIGGSEIEPVNSNDVLTIPSGKIQLQTASEGYEISCNYTDNTFEIKEQDGTNVLKYDSDTANIDFGVSIGVPTFNFNNYIIHGSGNARWMSYGGIRTAFITEGLIQRLTCEQFLLETPASVSSALTLSNDGRMSNSHGKWNFEHLYGNTSDGNYIKYNGYGFDIHAYEYGSGISYNLGFKNTATSTDYGIIGCANNGDLLLHMNGVGEALRVYVEDGKACCRLNNALRIDGYVNTGNTGLSGAQLDGTLISTYEFRPYDNLYWQILGGSVSSHPWWNLYASDYDPPNINATSVSCIMLGSIVLQNGGIFLPCDRRLKIDISKIDNTFALGVISRCNMYKYRYKDCFNHKNEWDYNLMADEVDIAYPEAVTRSRDFLPDIMCGVKATFTERKDKKYDMFIPHNTKWGSDYIRKGAKYRFLIADNDTDFTLNKHSILDLVCSKQNTFIVEREYKYVLFYGIESDDVMSVDKEKIFSLYHSCIQELHKQNIDQQSQIDKLTTDIQELKAAFASKFTVTT